MFNVKRRRQVQQLWHHQPSGVVIPAGTHTDLSTSCSETLLEIKEKALAVECLYRENKIKIPQNCDLSRLIGDSKAVSDAWFMDTLALVPIERQLNILHLNRVADAILPLARREGVARYLVPLTSGTLNLFDRTKSPAKDILWELELWSILKKSSLDVRFGEPDLLITLNDSILSVACKKLYSDRHLQNVLSQAVRQIEARGECGIVAINLDDLLPPNKILQMPSDQSTQEFVTQLNNLFLFRHQRHFRKYLASGRMLSVLVSTAVVADIPTAQPRLHNVRRASVWTLQGLPVDQDRLLRNFYQQLMH